MVTMAVISGAMSAMKAVGETAKSMIAIHDAAILRSKVAELNTQVVTAQTSALAALSDQFELLQRVDDLEKKVADFEKWENEKKRYELTKVGTGSFAFALKKSASASEIPHWICPTCYQNRKKTIMQEAAVQMSAHMRSGKTWCCPACQTKLQLRSDAEPALIDG